MDVTVIRKNKRTVKNRRQNKGGYDGPERRKNVNRGELDNQLHEMMEREKKAKELKKKSHSPSGNGSIIRRRKNEIDKRVA